MYYFLHFYIFSLGIPDYKTKLSLIYKLVKSLPPVNHDTMELLFGHLQRFDSLIFLLLIFKCISLEVKAFDKTVQSSCSVKISLAFSRRLVNKQHQEEQRKQQG